MSSVMEDGDVILIAPQAKNQDGSQTFYILDPCPSSEECSDDPPELELIDLTAEVKNTGAIAVLSTNSSTGALEITLTKKGERPTLKVEEMDSARENEEVQLDTASAGASKELVVYEDLDKHPIKEEDDVDVEEEITLFDVHNESGCSEQRSEEESVNVDTSEENLEVQNEQDEEPEEGVLYIDDAKYPEFQEECIQEDPENIKEYETDIIEEIETSVVEVKTHSSVESIDSSANQTNDGTSNEDLQMDEISIGNNESSDGGEALIHGQLLKMPSKNHGLTQKSDESEFVKSTNTALTLLELAGGTSFRNINEIEQDLIPPPVQFVSPSEDQSPPHGESTLTTLQPVPLDTPVSAGNLDADVLQIKPNVMSTPKPTVSVKVSNEMVQRLISGDTQMLGNKGLKSQYKHLASSVVSPKEIADEILKRSQEKCTYTEPPRGDYIFAMKLAHRLATRIVPAEKPVSSIENASTERSEQEPSVVVSSQDHIPPPRKGSISTTNVGNFNSEKITEKQRPAQRQSQQRDAMSDKIELLKILEDDPDDISDLKSPLIIDQTPKMRKSKARASPLIKLHPELEKELALKQLHDFNQEQRKKRSAFIPEALRKVPKQENEPLKKQERNNNLNTRNGSNHTNSTKRKINEPSDKLLKKIKTGIVDGKALTVDPSQITETLSVEGHDLVGDPSKDCKSIKQYSNKRLSRSSETPPREVPMEILLNGVDDVDLSKNKIFKATNPRKRQEELKRKRQKHFANVLQRNKPHKKRGRPPKKKPVLPIDDPFSQELRLNAKRIKTRPKSKNSLEEKPPEESASSSTGKPKTKTSREIERLLGDEGAINMLYSVEQKRTTGSEPKRGDMLPSYRRKKKDLILKTKLVKSAVLRLTTSPLLPAGRVSLRGQATKDDESEENTDASSLRKMSVDSRDSHHSLPSPSNENFSFPAKIVPAEASRIIRRHSSSSNYSSRSNSPRRMSIDGANVTSPEKQTAEFGQGDGPLPIANKHKPIKSPHHPPDGTVVKKSEEKSKEINLNIEHSQQPTSTKTSIGKYKSSVRFKMGKTDNAAKLGPASIGKYKSSVRFKMGKTDSAAKLGPGRPRKKLAQDQTTKTVELNTSLAAAVNDFTKEIENIDRNIPSEKPKTQAPLTVPSSGMNTRTSTSKIAVYRKSAASQSRPRALKGAVVYKELSLKRYGHLVEIILSPVSTKLKNAFNVNVFKELISVMNGLTKDENCRVVLITSTGSVFCQGVDFFALIQPTSEKRMAAALEMAVAVKDLIKALAMFSKPVVAGVQGAAVGLGTTMLPLFDLVFAHDQATFSTPYAKLGQVPEGAATLTLPSLLGSSATSELLFACRKLTASEALHFGLVTRILPSENFHEELIPILGAMASQSSQSMDATKALLRHNLLAGLETTLVSETHMLIQHWTGQECQANFTRYLQDEDHTLDFQKQPT